MLTKYVLHDQGGGRFTVGPEVEDDPCARCGQESRPNVCARDGRYHHHGRVHTVSDGLEALCAFHADEAEREWRDRKAELSNR